MPGMSLRGGDRGFPPATMNVAPGYFQKNIEEKQNQKKPLAAWFPTNLLYLPSNLRSWWQPCFALCYGVKYTGNVVSISHPYRPTYICLSFRHLCTIFSILEEFISLRRKNSLILNCKCTHIYTRLYLPTFLHL